MACSFPQSLLAAAVAVVVGGSLLAQDTPLKEASKALRLGQKEAAVEKLREILSSDPSNEDAMAVRASLPEETGVRSRTLRGKMCPL